MSVTFRPAKRENVPLLIGLAGGTGSGKTWSAMALAKGLAGGQRFAVIDTEAGRAKHYADEFAFDHADLTPPFRPTAYADAIATADKQGYPVIVIDSFSHEHAGEGGLLDWHEEEFQRLGGRDSVKMTAWIKPKMEHRKMVGRLLQVRAHLVICLRAQESVEIVKVDGKTVVRPKQTLTGADGWVPVAERNLPYELTASLLLTADAPGVPKPIKLPQQFRPFVPLDRPLSEETGRLLAEWAKGSGEGPSGSIRRPATPPAVDAQVSAEAEASASSPDVRPGASPPEAAGGRTSPPAAELRVITEGQLKRLHTIASNRGVPRDEAKRIITEVAGVGSSKQVTRDVYEAVCASLEAWEPPPSQFVIPEGARAEA